MTTGSEPNATARVLVTGASGFIGSHVVEELEARGFRVRALVRSTSSLSFLGEDVELARGDVSDPASIRAALSGVQGVIHCAGLTRALALDGYRKVNRDGVEKLLAACAAMSSRPVRIVCLSSLAAFGPSRKGEPVREDDEPHPVSDYGRSKLEGHRVAESFMKDLPISIIIPPAVYGPRDRDIYTYFRLARLRVAPFLGRGERNMSIVYATDVARAAVACLCREEAVGRSYFVEDGEVHTWRSLAAAIGEAMRVKTVPVMMPRFAARIVAFAADCSSRVTGRPPLLGRQKMGELLQRSWTCSSARIRRELQFQFEYPLRRGIEDTYRWYLSHHWL